MKAFETFHPIVLFSFFVATIGLSMIFMHPVYLTITIFSAISLNIALRRQLFFKDWKLYVPLFFLMAIINPMISHNGQLVLLYVNGNAITVEAILYGIAIATMIVAIMLWFSCYNVMMTSDKFIYLFGKVSPALSLTLSISLRLVPRFKHQLTQIVQAQKVIGMDFTTGSLWHRIKCTVRILSILITWALDNAIDTADSMKARGYGVKKRTAFSIFIFERRDGFVLAMIILLFFSNLVASFIGTTTYYFYPTFGAVKWDMTSILFYISYVILLSIPLVFEIWGALKWRSLKSTM
ncbi:energy-coupling factor transporter transmembrane protein EcfT [Lysinibacillus mangiferihumi]|uniref:Energy-coupling factor transporter transmembrane protein EcfT n=1 Tax=Lysinibacillus mangiferihumi TaxID=1130819 RepID=A0A4U2YXI5_9BACI|nr:energy-coupling factor transporter transmembrane component T [Lysinibacillus mangiferihumi]TKI66299.1 energy-coupling factor transporter transmembrane protein EcfT [Lysinibacillus mangiferihumi]